MKNKEVINYLEKLNKNEYIIKYGLRGSNAPECVTADDNKDMKQAIDKLIEKLIEVIKVDWEKFEDIIPILTNAYNRYKIDEDDGVGYIIDITKMEDLAMVTIPNDVMGRFYYDYKFGNATKYVFFDYCENGVPNQILNHTELLEKINESLYDVILTMLENPFSHDDYKELYSITIGYFISEEQGNNGW